MTIQHRCLIVLMSLISVMNLTGCATVGKNSLPPNDGLTMAQIYQQETGLSQGTSEESLPSLDSVRKSVVSDRGDVLQGRYTAITTTEINQHFKPLDNPQVPMYVYPHLVNQGGEAVPVPGYTTAFYLYRSNHFALPSEKY